MIASRRRVFLHRLCQERHAGGENAAALEPHALARRRTMIFDVPPRMEDDPRGTERRLFAKVPYVQTGT